MAKSPRYGIITLQNKPWAEMVRRWRRVEELGFESVWLADHFVNPYQTSQDWLEAWTLLPALATQTSRVRLGTLVTPFALRHPAMLARQALTVDHISGGRLEIGLGSGTGHDASFHMLGIPDWDNAERVGRFREAVQIIDGMLRNPLTTYERKYYNVAEAAMNPMPIQQPRPPLTIAALGPSMIKIAARYADRWNTYPGRGVTPEDAPAEIRKRGQLLDEYCEQIGRDPSEITRSLLVFGGNLRPFESVQAFRDIVGSYEGSGITEFIFYYPEPEEYAGAGASSEDLLERVATGVIGATP